MVKEAMTNPDDRAEIFDNGWLDDQLWTQAIRTFHHLEVKTASRAYWGDGSVLHGLLVMGLTDQHKEDRPFDASTRSMRYTGIVAHRLWNMLAEEKDRVRSTFLSPKVHHLTSLL
jgi:hypothetical protein